MYYKTRPAMVQRMFAYQITDGDFFKLENLKVSQ